MTKQEFDDEVAKVKAEAQAKIDAATKNAQDIIDKSKAECETTITELKTECAEKVNEITESYNALKAQYESKSVNISYKEASLIILGSVVIGALLHAIIQG